MDDLIPWIFGAWALVIFAAIVWTFWRMAARAKAGDPVFVVPPAGSAAPAVGPDASMHRVGAWVNGVHGTWPTYQVSVDDHCLVLRGGLSGTVSVARSEVTAVEPVKAMAASGFQFRTETGRLDRVAVFPLGRSLLDELSTRGWPVLRQPPRPINRRLWRI